MSPPLSSPETDEETDKPASPRPTVSREGAAEDALETAAQPLLMETPAVDDLVKTATDPPCSAACTRGGRPGSR